MKLLLLIFAVCVGLYSLPAEADPDALNRRSKRRRKAFCRAAILDGQRETIAGVRGAFHIVPSQGIDGLVEAGRSWYDASPVSRPGTQAPGDYYHAGASRKHNRGTAFLDYYRMDARYATIILPYGVPENQWSARLRGPVSG